MEKQDGGKIVYLSSTGGGTGRPGVAVNYAASKAAVIGLTQLLARELGPSGIYVNAIAPGPILTEQTRQHPPKYSPSGMREVLIVKGGQATGRPWSEHVLPGGG